MLQTLVRYTCARIAQCAVGTYQAGYRGPVNSEPFVMRAGRMAEDRNLTRRLLSNSAYARVVELADGRVVKEFSNVKQANWEWHAMQRLSSLFKEVRVKEWKYRTVQPLFRSEDEGRITMTKAGGVPMTEALRRDPKLAWHAGVWIGLFHESNRQDDQTVLSYPDYISDHVFIDLEGKTVTLLDPGVQVGKMKFPPERDLLKFSEDTVVNLLPSVGAAASAVWNLFMGYGSVCEHPLSQERFKASRHQVQGEAPTRWFKRSRLVRVPYRLLMMSLSGFARLTTWRQQR